MHFRLRALFSILILAALVLTFRGGPAPAMAAARASQSAGPHVLSKDQSLPVVFFDLGNVLIDTTNPTQFHFTVGGQAYVNSLITNGYTLGLISNIPQSWGTTQDEKFAKLKSYVAQSWADPTPFPWADFTYVLLPPNDALRKPNPYLFNEALGLAGACAPVYQGESQPEITVAQQLGFFGFLTTTPTTGGAISFAPLSQLYCRPHPAPSPAGSLRQGDL